MMVRCAARQRTLLFLSEKTIKPHQNTSLFSPLFSPTPPLGIVILVIEAVTKQQKTK
jgi:hypothetical protein